MDVINLAAIILGGAALAALAVLAMVAARGWKEAASLRAALEAARDQRAEALAKLAGEQARASRIDTVAAELEAERERRLTRERELAGLKSAMDEREAAAARERSERTKLVEDMRLAFHKLAGEALDASQARLLERAAETFKVQQEKGEAGVKGLVDPIREKLDAFKAKVESIEKDRAAHRGEMGAQLRQLSAGLDAQSAQTRNLVNALQRSSTTRGQWGERTVENILELAGLTKGIDYESQHHARDSDGGALRPDFVVRLPGGARFVIDSKVALTAYLDAVEAPDETARKDALRRHAAQVRTHVRQLSKKEYAAAVDGAIDFVALFIPGESFYSAAIEEQPDLFDEAIRANVIITTPSTLLALAKAVAYGWRQQRLEADAREIGAMGAELYNRLATFGGHMAGVGKGLAQATRRYNDAVGSLERGVLPQARRFAALDGVKASKSVDAIEQVDEAPRRLASPDWEEPDETQRGEGETGETGLAGTDDLDRIGRGD